MSSAPDRERRRARCGLVLLGLGAIGLVTCLLTLGVRGWAYGYALFAVGWLAWMHLSPDSAANRPRRMPRADQPPAADDAPRPQDPDLVHEFRTAGAGEDESRE